MASTHLEFECADEVIDVVYRRLLATFICITNGSVHGSSVLLITFHYDGFSKSCLDLSSLYRRKTSSVEVSAHLIFPTDSVSNPIHCLCKAGKPVRVKSVASQRKYEEACYAAYNINQLNIFYASMLETRSSFWPLAEKHRK